MIYPLGEIGILLVLLEPPDQQKVRICPDFRLHLCALPAAVIWLPEVDRTSPNRSLHEHAIRHQAVSDFAGPSWIRTAANIFRYGFAMDVEFSHINYEQA